MEAKTKTVITFAVLILIVFGLYFFTDWFSKFTGYAPGEDEKEAFARCLSKNGAIFYFSLTCPKCDEQAEIFGETAWRLVDKYECKNIEGCLAPGGVPAWEIDEEFYYGFKEFKELKKITGCE